MFLLICALLLQPVDTNRELSVSNIKKEDREKYLQIVSFILNSLSKERRITVPKLEDDKIKFDLADYGINSTIFDNLLNTYKQPRADDFIDKALKSPNYYKLLEIENLESFNKLIQYKESFQARGIIINSHIARYSRVISREPLLNGGSLWKTYDTKNDTDFFLNKQADSTSYIGSLPNGLLVYFATDNKKNPLHFIDPAMAIDHISEDKMVKVASSCVTCHTSGITAFKNTLKELTQKDIEIKTKDKKIIDMFQRDIEKYFTRDQEDYAEAVKRVNSLTPKKNATQLKQLIDEYNKPLTKEICAKELNITIEELENKIKKIPFLDIELANLLVRNQIRRDQWERIHKLLK